MFHRPLAFGSMLVLGLLAATAPVHAQVEPDPLTRLLNETPPVSEVVEAALRHAEIFRGGVARWEPRSRYKAAFPMLEVALSRDLNDGSSLDSSRTIFGSASVETSPGSFGNVVQGPDDETYRKTTADGQTLRLSVRWNLDEVVFNGDELRAARESQNLVDLKGTLSQRVIEQYFARLQHLLDLVTPGFAGGMERLKRELQVRQAAAQLDALTGGWFSEEVQRRSTGRP